MSLSLPSALQYEYFNAVLINEVNEDGNSVELGGEFLLQPNDHFNNLSVNLSLSVVQVPTNMYNKGTFTVSDVQYHTQQYKDCFIALIINETQEMNNIEHAFVQ